MQHRSMLALCATAALVIVPGALAERQFTVHHGNTVLSLDAAVLAAHGITVTNAAMEAPEDTATVINLNPFPAEEPLTIANDGAFSDGEVSHYWGMILNGPSGQFYASDIVVSVLAQPQDQLPIQFVTSNVSFDQDLALLLIESDAFVASSEVTNSLGTPALLGQRLGSAVTKVFLAQHHTGDMLDTLDGNQKGEIGGGEIIDRGGCTPSTGPDVIVGDTTIANYTAVGGIDAFSVGTTSCNIGSVNLLWNSGTVNHPIIPQNMYRYKVVNGAGRFEQIGQSWMKHAFTALTQNLCCTCNGSGGSVLGIGCSDPYTAGRNGEQITTVGGLGPRFQVNAHSGAFIFPYMFRNTSHITHTAITRRLQVAMTDLDPAVNVGAEYVFDAQYVTPDDATARNQDNNVSYRTATIAGNATNVNATMTGTTQRQMAGIQRWKVIDPAVVETNFETREASNAGGDNSAKAILSARVVEVTPGTWNYEYALYNMNSHRSFSSFTIPLADVLPATDIGFHDVAYHSGDGFGSAVGSVINYDGTDWPGTKIAGAIQWALVPASPVDNSNALRWGTMYNFRFRTTVAPVNGNATAGHYRAVVGLPDTQDIATLIPGPAPILPCPGDIDGDRDVDLSDLSGLLSNFGFVGGQTLADGDLDGDGDVDLSDLSQMLAVFGSVCP